MQTSTTALSFHPSTRAFARLGLLALTACVLTTTAARAQLFYSIDFLGPTIGLPASAPAGATIGAGDVLTSAPAGATPQIVLSAASIGIVPSPATGQPEVDALSFGNDPLIGCVGNPPFLFSVDEFAVGAPGAPAPPNVTTEGAIGNQEASADVYRSNALPPPPICPGAPSGNNGFADGNGVAPFAAPGLDLIEPNPPTPDPMPDPGDNLDAVACSNFTGRIFFSLDAAWADRFEGPAVHSGTALANGGVPPFSPGDVLVSGVGGGGITVFASHTALGLLWFDDLDALVLRDNGNGVYDPSNVPLDWNGGQTDMLLFSVTRDSPLVGAFDAIHGVAINEGDILTPTAGGPGIFVTAEALGLWTSRTHGASPLPLFYDDFDAEDVDGISDNLDGLSLRACVPMD